jgi:hypothetical protein
VGFDDDGDVNQTYIEDTEVNYLNTVENAFYFSTPSFTDLLCLPHRWARQKFYKLLNRNVSNLKRRQKASLTRELSSSQWQRMKVEQIAGLPFDYPDICDQRKEYRNNLNRDSKFSGSKWHCLLDSVAFAFPQLQVKEGDILTGFRVFVTTTCDVAPGEFAVDMNPEVAQIQKGELTLSKLENQTLCWGDIYNDLCALLAASQKTVLERRDVVAAVFGSYDYADQKRVPNLHRHLCDRRKKLREIFSCDQNPKHGPTRRGDCRCELGWVPLSEELLKKVENINPLVVPQGGLSLPAGGSSSALGEIVIPVQDTNIQSFIDEDEKKSGDQL